MYCIHCGEQVVASANFCGACGTKVIRQDEGGSGLSPGCPCRQPPIGRNCRRPGDGRSTSVPDDTIGLRLGETSASSATGEAENFDIQVGALGAFFRTCIDRVTGHRRLRP